jgi:hypothetical protein
MAGDLELEPLLPRMDSLDLLIDLKIEDLDLVLETTRLSGSHAVSRSTTVCTCLSKLALRD